MGLLKHLLFWPVTGPLFLSRFSMEQVDGTVKRELTDDDAVKAELLEAQLALETGTIDEEEYVRREAELMERLREVRAWRAHFGLDTAGGVVRVQRDAGGIEEATPAVIQPAETRHE